MATQRNSTSVSSGTGRGGTRKANAAGSKSPSKATVAHSTVNASQGSKLAITKASLSKQNLAKSGSVTKPAPARGSSSQLGKGQAASQAASKKLSAAPESLGRVKKTLSEKASRIASLKNLIFKGASASRSAGLNKTTKPGASEKVVDKKSAHSAHKAATGKSASHASGKSGHVKAHAHDKAASSKSHGKHAAAPASRSAAPAAKAGKGKPAGKSSAVDNSPSAAIARAKKKTSGESSASSRLSAATDESVCREVACEGLATTGGYCRMHYIKNWKKIKRKEVILKEKKLNQYIEELVAKYPEKYIEAIRQDLASDRDFAKVIADLDLDESVDDFEMDGDNADSFIDTIRRDFEDEGGESF